MKLTTWIVLVPMAIIAAALAVANRVAVTVSLDPFSLASPAIAFTLPLYQLIFGALALGVILGLLARGFGRAPVAKGNGTGALTGPAKA
ncbi:MAG: hypothetical protein HXY22_00365 [Alphaproteobacteria bacterium]|nr:hypothetical protein [Alphaproteobacteria bacterium]